MSTAGLRISLERGISAACRARAVRRLEKPWVGELVQMASEYADAKGLRMVDLAGLPWFDKPAAIRRWLLGV